MERKLIPFLLLFLLCLTGCQKTEEELEAERMQKLYGENKEITGTYDDSLAIKCNNGTFIGLQEDSVIAYKGIPYAIPPVGERRWKVPEAALDDDGVYEAYYFGKSPIQSEWPSEAGSYYPQSEDCLTLNVWVNEEDFKDEDAEKKPVMVFFHGGAYGWGGVSDPVYDGHNLVEKFDNIILVTVEYRVGIMGFIDFSSVPGGEEFKESGNLGLLDQICALKWVQKNIGSFGGDAGNVTIFGESAGAGSVSLLPLIDESEGLFQRIIAESGTVALTYSREECQNLTEKLLKDTECATMDELMALSEDQISSYNESLNDYNNFPERDGIILPEDPYEAYENGEEGSFDMMIGSNSDEVRYWIREMGYEAPLIGGYTVYAHGLPIVFENNMATLSEEEKADVKEFMAMQTGEKKVWRQTEFYNELLFRIPAMKQASIHSDNGNNVYTYYWTYPGEDDLIKACHAIELSYVFNNLDEKIYTGNKVNEELADEVQKMWVNFACTGDPSTDSHTWEKYDTDTRKTIVLGDDIHMEEDLKKEQRELLEPLLGHYFNGCYTQLSLDVPQVYRIEVQLVSGLIIFIVLITVAIIFRKKHLKNWIKERKRLRDE